MAGEADWVSAGIGLGGAIIGGICTIIGVRMQAAKAAADQLQREERFLRAMKQAMHDELETIWDMYMQTAGAQVAALQGDAPYLGIWPVSHDYFTVFQANAVNIGHIPDHDLRKALIVTYNAARGLVDSFRLNNVLSEQFQNAHTLNTQYPSPQNKQIEAMRLQALIQYAPNLKRGHERLKGYVDDVLRRLRKAGALTEH